MLTSTDAVLPHPGSVSAWILVASYKAINKTSSGNQTGYKQTCNVLSNCLQSSYPTTNKSDYNWEIKP